MYDSDEFCTLKYTTLLYTTRDLIIYTYYGQMALKTFISNSFDRSSDQVLSNLNVLL